jgi:hypothetical protein
VWGIFLKDRLFFSIRQLSGSTAELPELRKHRLNIVKKIDISRKYAVDEECNIRK